MVNRRVSHAYCFAGPQGVGKATTARVFACALLCPTSNEGIPCGTCHTCRRLARGVHPDLHWLASEGTLGIDDVRRLQGELSLAAFEAERKFAVIDGADALTVPAQNALLKLLEEPPGDTVIVLVAENPSNLLPTIRSRTQTLRFQPLPLEVVARDLMAQGAKVKEARLIAAVAEGSLGTARAALKEGIVARRNEVAAWCDQLSGAMGRRAILTVGQRLEGEKEHIDVYLNFFLLWFRDLLLVREGAHEAVANQDIVEEIQQRAAGFEAHRLVQAMRAVDGARRNIQGNANLRITLDVMLTNVQRSLAAS